LPEETYGHINSAFCDGMATTVMVAHHFIWRHLYASIQAAQTPTSKLRFVTPDKESSMSTLWQEEEFKQISSRESLTEKAAVIEKTISVKEHERKRYDFNLTMFYENRFWNRRPDGIVIENNYPTLYILEFKRSSDRNIDFLKVKEDEANKQDRSSSRRSERLPWNGRLYRLIFWQGVVVQYWKMTSMTISISSMSQAGEKDKILLAHVQRICEAHDTVMRSYYQQIHKKIAFHTSACQRRSQDSGCLGLTRRRRWRTLEYKCMCK